MKKIKLIALIAALLVGIGAYQVITELQKPVEFPKSTVYVAAVDIEENTKITEEMLTKTEVAVEDKHPNSETNIENIVGMVLSSKVYAGEQILSSRLLAVGDDSNDTGNLAYKIQPGMRAITVEAGGEKGVANMLRVGDHVDVMVFYSYQKNKNNKDEEPISVSDISLQNVKILAIDSMRTKGTPETAYTTVTLEVTPQDAVLMNYENCTGMDVRFILRSPVDEEVVDPTEITSDNIRNYVTGKK